MSTRQATDDGHGIESMTPDQAGAAGEARSRSGDPCLGLRRAVDARCGFATRARAEAEAAEVRVNETQRLYQLQLQSLARAESSLDLRGALADKDAAHRAFRKSVRAASERSQVEMAAIVWLDEINRINGAVRTAQLRISREREVADGLLPELYRLTSAAEMSRATAETAAAACLSAREELAACQETAAAARAARVAVAGHHAAALEAVDEDAGSTIAAVASPGDQGADGSAPVPDGALEVAASAEPDVVAAVPVSAAAAVDATPPVAAPAVDAATPAAVPASAWAQAATSGAQAATVWASATRPGPPVWVMADEREGEAAPAFDPTGEWQPAIVRLLRRDGRVIDQLVSELAATGAERVRWQLLLSDLVDAFFAAAIEAAYLDLPPDNAFWCLFTKEQARDVAQGLAALGFRYDGLGAFADGRVPGQRELALAVGHAGLNPIRIRFWPSRDQAGELFRGARVDADTFLAERAPSLTLGELVTALGRRAELLTPLWNEWGRIRPMLVALV